MLTAFFVLLGVVVLVIFVRALRAPYEGFDQVTVTRIYDEIETKGVIARKFKPNGQPYVIDPVDGAEWMLNTRDTYYEDVNKDMWRLV